MKIINRLLTENESLGILKLSGNIFTINGFDYDLDNLSLRVKLVELSEKDMPTPQEILDGVSIYKNQAEYDAQRVWKDEAGEKYALVIVDTVRQHAWINDNMRDLFGFSDGIVTLEELAVYIEWDNAIQAILDDYPQADFDKLFEIVSMKKSLMMEAKQALREKIDIFKAEKKESNGKDQSKSQAELDCETALNDFNVAEKDHRASVANANKPNIERGNRLNALTKSYLDNAKK